jgi:hypothetical protein
MTNGPTPCLRKLVSSAAFPSGAYQSRESKNIGLFFSGIYALRSPPHTSTVVLLLKIPLVGQFSLIRIVKNVQ